MTLGIEAEIQGSLRAYLGGEAAAVVAGARAAVQRQTEETKLAARRVVSGGLKTRGRRNPANSIRSKYYQDSPAGFVHSTWGYFQGGQFVDILAAHERGATILPKKGRFLFIPAVPGGRKKFQQGIKADRIELAKTGEGFAVLLTAGRGAAKRATLIGILVRRVRLPKRLDFSAVERQALTGLAEKSIVEIERASQRLGA